MSNVFSCVTGFHQQRITNTNPLVNIDGDEIHRVTLTQPLPTPHPLNPLHRHCPRREQKPTHYFSLGPLPKYWNAWPGSQIWPGIWPRYVRKHTLSWWTLQRLAQSPVRVACTLHMESTWELTGSTSAPETATFSEHNWTWPWAWLWQAEVNFLSFLGQDPVWIVLLCLIKFSAQ